MLGRPPRSGHHDGLVVDTHGHWTPRQLVVAMMVMPMVSMVVVVVVVVVVVAAVVEVVEEVVELGVPSM